MSSAVRILSTRILHQESVSTLGERGVEVIQHNFIQTNINLPPDTDMNAFHRDIIITSKSGVEAFHRMFENNALPRQYFRFHSIARGTREKALQYGFDIIHTGKDAIELADQIIADKDISSVTHICGNLRRSELSDRLRNSGKEVQEVVVYSTEFSPISVGGNYNAIIFFSPSAVDSFLSQNAIPSATTFCIGKTTARYAGEKGFRKIYIAANPSEESLVEAILENYPKRTNA